MELLFRNEESKTGSELQLDVCLLLFFLIHSTHTVQIKNPQVQRCPGRTPIKTKKKYSEY